MNIKNNKNTPASNEKNTGSSAEGEPVFLIIGKLRRSHGLQGEILMEITTHFPERLCPGKLIYLGEHHTPFHIESIRWANKNVLIKIAEIDTPEAIAPLRNQFVYVSSENLPDLPENEYYHHQLIGLRAETEDGKILGTIKDILETGANDVYVIDSGQGQETLLPAIYDVILSYDLEAGKLIVRLPEYL